MQRYALRDRGGCGVVFTPRAAPRGRGSGARCSPGRLLVLLSLLSAACTPWATYPPIEGSVDVHDPSLSPIPQVMAAAIRYAYRADGRGGEIVFNLPPNTPTEVYDKVIAALGEGRPLTVAGEVAYHVTQVRVRTVESEVDLIHRNEHGVPHEMTIAFRSDLIRGFRVARVRPWRYRVSEPPPYFSAARSPAAVGEPEEAGRPAPPAGRTTPGLAGAEDDPDAPGV